MTIGPKTIEIMKGLACEQLDTFASKMGEAFLKSEDGKLKVSISLDVGVSEIQRNALDIDATISFTTERVKFKVSKTVNELQAEMFDAVEKYRPKGE